LIPAGTKGVIKGIMFNKIVKNIILELNLDCNRYKVVFEKSCIYHSTSEIPDWYIFDMVSNKILIGMNQLDIWGGGHQSNRGSNYINNSIIHNNDKCKLLCVICNEIIFKSTSNKIFKLFEIGFNNNTLCYIKNLTNIIMEFFDIRCSE